MSLKNAFKTIISMQGFEVTITTANKASTATLKMAKSNMDRKLQGIEDSTYDGHEMVVSKDDLDNAGFPKPKRGDRITSSLLSTLHVDDVIPQIAFGVIIGYRLRCN